MYEGTTLALGGGGGGGALGAVTLRAAVAFCLLVRCAALLDWI